MTHIIGTISELDVPMNPSAKGQTRVAWFNGITEADFQQGDQILDATLYDIHALADLVDAALKQEQHLRCLEAKQPFRKRKNCLRT